MNRTIRAWTLQMDGGTDCWREAAPSLRGRNLQALEELLDSLQMHENALVTLVLDPSRPEPLGIRHYGGVYVRGGISWTSLRVMLEVLSNPRRKEGILVISFR